MSRRDRRKKRRGSPNIPGLSEGQVIELADNLLNLQAKSEEFKGGTPRFRVGDRVRITVQTQPKWFGDVVTPDPEVGSLGTIRQTHKYPVYGVQVDGEEKLGLSGYHDDELELLSRREGR